MGATVLNIMNKLVIDFDLFQNSSALGSTIFNTDNSLPGRGSQS